MSRNSEGIIGALASKPEALLLLAAGAALMLRSGGSEGSTRKAFEDGTRSAKRRQSANDTQAGESEGRWTDGLNSVVDRAKDSAGKARSYVSDVADRTVETAGGYASSVTDSVTDYAERARRSVINGSEQMAETAQQTVARVIREQPLSVALMGLAAGAAVAATFPATRVENSFFGPAKKKLAEAVGDAGEKLKSAGQHAGEKLAEVVDEHGLNRDGLRDAAADVAQAFGSGLRAGDINGRSRTRAAETDHE